MRYLEVGDVLFLYERHIGSTNALTDPGKLEAAVIRPQTEYYGEAQFPTLMLKAAALLHGIVEAHAFLDGNKRIGTIAAATFLVGGGRPPAWDDDEAKDFIVEIAQGLHSVERIADWLDGNCEPEAEDDGDG